MNKLYYIAPQMEQIEMEIETEACLANSPNDAALNSCYMEKGNVENGDW